MWIQDLKPFFTCESGWLFNELHEYIHEGQVLGGLNACDSCRPAISRQVLITKISLQIARTHRHRRQGIHSTILDSVL